MWRGDLLEEGKLFAVQPKEVKEKHSSFHMGFHKHSVVEYSFDVSLEFASSILELVFLALIKIEFFRKLRSLQFQPFEFERPESLV